MTRTTKILNHVHADISSGQSPNPRVHQLLRHAVAPRHHQDVTRPDIQHAVHTADSQSPGSASLNPLFRPWPGCWGELSFPLGDHVE